ncbi:hypothetical protein RJT34_16133 [Clitoria ternatea]|uniref:Uncharacterized protein n=1 Tax=Clitoria ternatea TaxID=43366 RepID=A0AAN9PC10_CLITE
MHTKVIVLSQVVLIKRVSVNKTKRLDVAPSEAVAVMVLLQWSKLIVSESNQRPPNEPTLTESSGQPKEVDEEDCYADILKNDIIKLDESSIPGEGHTRTQDPEQTYPCQGTAQRRIRVGNSKLSTSAGVRFPSTKHSSKTKNGIFAGMTNRLVVKKETEVKKKEVNAIEIMDVMPNTSLSQHESTMPVKLGVGASWGEALTSHSYPSLSINRPHNMNLISNYMLDFNMAHHYHYHQLINGKNACSIEF